MALDNEFPGDHTGGETPDPIPNSEAKPVRPMIVPRGESRLSPGFIRPADESQPAFPLGRISINRDMLDLSRGIGTSLSCVLRVANNVSRRILSFLRGTLFGEKGGTRLGGGKWRLNLKFIEFGLAHF